MAAAVIPLSLLAQSAAVPGAKPLVEAEGRSRAFAVASVRRNVSGKGMCDPEHLYLAADGFRMTNCPLMAALFMAYVPANGAALGFSTEGRVVGAPDWMRSEKYDIVARIDEADVTAWQDPATQQEMLHAMMQSLLAERCKLTAHREMRDKPIYALVQSKKGLKLHEAESTDQATVVRKHPSAGVIPGGGGMFSFEAGGNMELYGASMETLAILLSNMAGRQVVDKTGLTGKYDIKLKTMETGSPAAETTNDSESSIFTVVQEQLGLKLESAKGTVETVVIDHVERPEEN